LDFDIICTIFTGSDVVASKLRIRIGEVEIEYEGSDEFLKEELPELLKTAMELRKTAAATGNGEQKGATAGGGGGREPS
jgi:hypothetical protein